MNAIINKIKSLFSAENIREYSTLENALLIIYLIVLFVFIIYIIGLPG